jgi:hypothetical protein
VSLVVSKLEGLYTKEAVKWLMNTAGNATQSLLSALRARAKEQLIREAF